MSQLRMRWPEYWSFSFSIIPSKEIPGLISFRDGLVGSPCSPRDSQVFSNTTVQTHQFFGTIFLDSIYMCQYSGWHHWLDGRESEWTPGVGDGQGGLACCRSWGCKESDTTEQLNWTELTWRNKIQNKYRRLQSLQLIPFPKVITNSTSIKINIACFWTLCLTYFT